jgi:uncharacterized protein YeaO (DUF488 family)
MLRTKSVHSLIDRKADGLRILATRFRGRGLPASRYDVWMPSLGPSEALLRKVLGGEITWSVFARTFRKEMVMSDAIDERNRSIKNHGQKFTLRLIKTLAARGPVTLMCHCAQDAEHCHRYELQKLIGRM